MKRVPNKSTKMNKQKIHGKNISKKGNHVRSNQRKK